MAQIAIVSGVESALLRAGARKSKFFRGWEFKASHTSKKGPNSNPAATRGEQLEARARAGKPVSLPARAMPISVGSLGYFESELLLDFGSALSWLGSVLFGMDDELPG